MYFLFNNCQSYTQHYNHENRLPLCLRCVTKDPDPYLEVYACTPLPPPVNSNRLLLNR